MIELQQQLITQSNWHFQIKVNVTSRILMFSMYLWHFGIKTLCLYQIDIHGVKVHALVQVLDATFRWHHHILYDRLLVVLHEACVSATEITHTQKGNSIWEMGQSSSGAPLLSSIPGEHFKIHTSSYKIGEVCPSLNNTTKQQSTPCLLRIAGVAVACHRTVCVCVHLHGVLQVAPELGVVHGAFLLLPHLLLLPLGQHPGHLGTAGTGRHTASLDGTHLITSSHTTTTAIHS